MIATAPAPILKKIQIGDILMNGFMPEMDDDEFIEWCRKQPNLKIEKDKHGNIYIMPPVNFEASSKEINIQTELVLWNRIARLGIVQNSMAGFRLPDRSMRMPDAAWISNEKVALLSEKERHSVPHLVPDFVAELRSSPDDSLADLKKKMTDDWMANGVQLAWLLDPIEQKAWIYRANGSIEVVTGFDHELSGEEVLPGFELDLRILKS